MNFSDDHGACGFTSLACAASIPGLVSFQDRLRSSYMTEAGLDASYQELYVVIPRLIIDCLLPQVLSSWGSTNAIASGGSRPHRCLLYGRASPFLP
jgi:hypothetical protein